MIVSAIVNQNNLFVGLGSLSRLLHTKCELMGSHEFGKPSWQTLAVRFYASYLEEPGVVQQNCNWGTGTHPDMISGKFSRVEKNYAHKQALPIQHSERGDRTQNL
jgi:hypothetical protein